MIQGMSPKRSDIRKPKFEGWGGINHIKDQAEDEGQEVDGKQLKHLEERIQGNHLFKKSGDESKYGTSRRKNILDRLTGNIWREERQGRRNRSKCHTMQS